MIDVIAFLGTVALLGTVGAFGVAYVIVGGIRAL